MKLSKSFYYIIHPQKSMKNFVSVGNYFVLYLDAFKNGQLKLKKENKPEVIQVV